MFEYRFKYISDSLGCTFIVLDTQDGKHEYVKLLQEEYNTYYADKSRKYMVNLEKKSVEIQNRMYDNVTQNLIEFQI